MLLVESVQKFNVCSFLCSCPNRILKSQMNADPDPDPKHQNRILLDTKQGTAHLSSSFWHCTSLNLCCTLYRKHCTQVLVTLVPRGRVLRCWGGCCSKSVQHSIAQILVTIVPRGRVLGCWGCGCCPDSVQHWIAQILVPIVPRGRVLY